MKTTTATTGLGGEPFTLELLLDAVKKLKALPKPSTKWIVVSPSGDVYEGEPEDVIRPLLAAHPLLQLPPYPPRMKMEDE